MPSAPTTMSASISLPSARRATPPRSHSSTAMQRAPKEIDRLERAAQHVEQVGAVHCQVRRAELLAERPSAHARDDPPTLPAAEDQKIRLRPKGDDCVLDAEVTERHQRVR